MPTDWRPRRGAGAVNHERPLGSRRGTARLPDAPGSLPADMRGQSGPCKDWIGQSIEGDPQVWHQTRRDARSPRTLQGSAASPRFFGVALLTLGGRGTRGDIVEEPFPLVSGTARQPADRTVAPLPHHVRLRRLPHRPCGHGGPHRARPEHEPHRTGHRRLPHDRAVPGPGGHRRGPGAQRAGHLGGVWRHPRVIQHGARAIVTLVMELLLNRAAPPAEFQRAPRRFESRCSSCWCSSNPFAIAWRNKTALASRRSRKMCAISPSGCRQLWSGLM